MGSSGGLLGGLGLAGLSAVLFQAYLQKVRRASLLERAVVCNGDEVEEVAGLENGQVVAVKGVLDGEPRLVQSIGDNVGAEESIFHQVETIRLVEDSVRRKEKVVSASKKGTKTEKVEMNEFVQKRERVDYSYEQANILKVGHITFRLPSQTNLGDFLSIVDEEQSKFEQANGGSKRTVGFYVVEKCIVGGRHSVFVIGTFQSHPQPTIIPTASISGLMEEEILQVCLEHPSEVAKKHRSLGTILVVLSSISAASGAALLAHSIVVGFQTS